MNHDLLVALMGDGYDRAIWTAKRGAAKPQQKTVVMSRKDYEREHKHLIELLNHLAGVESKEAKKQSAEPALRGGVDTPPGTPPGTPPRTPPGRAPPGTIPPPPAIPARQPPPTRGPINPAVGQRLTLGAPGGRPLTPDLMGMYPWASSSSASSASSAFIPSLPSTRTATPKSVVASTWSPPLYANSDEERMDSKEPDTDSEEEEEEERTVGRKSSTRSATSLPGQNPKKRGGNKRGKQCVRNIKGGCGKCGGTKGFIDPTL